MPETKLPINPEVLDRIGVKLKKTFDDTEKKRMLYRETEWLESVRQFKGIYDPEVKAKIRAGKSEVYPRYTRSKVQPCVAKLNNMLFPDNDKNWEIQPTPEPRLKQGQIDEIVESIDPVDAEGQPREVTTEEIDGAIMKYAQKKVDKMTITMDDQLTEVGYKAKAKSMIRSTVMLGTGILKGPLSKGHIKRQMVQEGEGYVQQETKEYKPFVSNPSLWRWFPDMSSTDFEHCDFAFELESMTKHELRKLAKKKNFRSNVIKEYIRNHKEGDYKLRQWEIDLKAVKDTENVLSQTNKYEVLEYNGYMDGQDLVEAGIISAEDDAADQDWFVNVWLLGDKVIKAIKHPIESLTELYHIFYFEKDDSSIFGEGLPVIIRDTQISICSSTRAMLDNAAWVAGPIFEMNSDLMPDEDLDDVYPGRVFEREGRGADAQYPAMRIYNVESRVSDYLAIIGKFEHIGDMESTLPAALFGEAAKTTNETAKGISIKSSNVNLTINDIVKNFDETNESFLKALYKWNLDYNEDESIKGDMEIKAVGSASLVSKEERTNAMDFFAQGLQDEDKPYVKRRALLEARIKMHDLDAKDILHTEAEAQQNIQNAVDSEMRELELAKLKSGIEYDNAKAANMDAKAEETTKGIPLKEIESMIAGLEKMRGGMDVKESAASAAG
ncbi:hypothetical protein KAR91_56700 [Candidatus Pacearchaeota archaeon]|nr:hypothetical protein [Candidatus Pacearchaeota archaeon]